MDCPTDRAIDRMFNWPLTKSAAISDVQ